MAYLRGTEETTGCTFSLLSGRWTLATRIQKAGNNLDVGQRFQLGVILNHKNIQNKSLPPMARGNKNRCLSDPKSLQRVFREDGWDGGK